MARVSGQIAPEQPTVQVHVDVRPPTPGGLRGLSREQIAEVRERLLGITGSVIDAPPRRDSTQLQAPREEHQDHEDEQDEDDDGPSQHN